MFEKLKNLFSSAKNYHSEKFLVQELYDNRAFTDEVISSLFNNYPKF
ncbi:hypothetical protein HMPREF9296_2021 [Prevotella disiens FB035-09AN]|uniref:Uncharacterized protein n=1 Tax=Prevotella disiens FB035-09AN TaxID=866771 RepID=E1KMS5_9BACT|nr:hypothetical protein HMPREF9296_2021 [Prevotella disiens FB035-09AN]